MATPLYRADELQALLDQNPSTPTPRSEIPRAAVAAIFRAGQADAELLFIQRATKANDPWSGQMAFPGGRSESHDTTATATAERETLEEVGLDLSPAHYLGDLCELDGGRATNRRVDVTAHAYWLPGKRPQLTANHEVADMVWVGLDMLTDTNRYIDYLYPPAEMTFPGIQLDKPEQVVWGLTLRFLTDLFERLERPFIR